MAPTPIETDLAVEQFRALLTRINGEAALALRLAMARAEQTKTAADLEVVVKITLRAEPDPRKPPVTLGGGGGFHAHWAAGQPAPIITPILGTPVLPRPSGVMAVFRRFFGG